MITFPNAKINIGLNITGKRSDGYHDLETIFYPLQLADALEMVESKKTGISFSGIPIEGDFKNNLIYKAWKLLHGDFKIPPVQFHLHKVIPFGAGLGGGSADAAFALKMLNEFFTLGLDESGLQKYALQIGADCSFFIHNKPVFAEGIGDVFSPVEIDLSEYDIVVLKPKCSVSTSDAYRKIKPAKQQFCLRETIKLQPENWEGKITNDFEKNVFVQYPEIRNLKEFLYQNGAVYAAMSGSGSAVFGLFRSSPTGIDNNIPEGVFIYR